MKRVILATRAARTHVLALGLAFVSHYVPGEVAQFAIPAVALVLGLPVSDATAVEKAAGATVAADAATVKADVAKAVDVAESAVSALVSPRSNA